MERRDIVSIMSYISGNALCSGLEAEIHGVLDNILGSNCEADSHRRLATHGD